jgi:hypothetical protein
MPLRLLAALLVFLIDAALAAEPAARYTLRYDAGSETMAVRLCVPVASARIHFSADHGAARYVDALTRENAPVLVADNDGWSAADWHAGECLAYRAALGRIAEAGRHRNSARHGGALTTDPGLWMLRPDVDAESLAPREVSVEMPAGFSISAPWHPLQSADGAKRFSIPQTPDDWMAHVAIGKFEEDPVVLPGGVIRVSILGNADAVQRAKLDAWISRVSRATLAAYGRFPLPDVQMLLVVASQNGAERDPVFGGESTRGQGHAVTLAVDPTQSAAAFDGDWVAVHELSHLFHPYLDDHGSWLAEGLATYYQNVLRARVGLITPARAWEQIDAGFARGRGGMPSVPGKLEDASSDFEEHPEFMRIYWSGTAFWLEVDTELRKSSGNKLSIDEALRRFDACCLPDYRGWAPEAFIAKLDTLLGTDVFRKHFAEYRARRDFPDLGPVYAELGLRRDGEKLIYDDAAPAADVRRAIMSAR